MKFCNPEFFCGFCLIHFSCHIVVGVDQVTDLTPWKFDDKVLDSLAARIAKMLPDLVRQFLGLKR